MSEITHASLFSGIGAVDLAAQQLGIRNVFNVEINPFCRTVLDYWFKESIGYTDVKTVDFTKYRGKITVLSGGFPCFVAGTPVLTINGVKPIEEIGVGEKVLAADKEYHEVESTMSHDADTIVFMRAQGMFEELKCTPNHKFLVRKRRTHHRGFDFAPAQWISISECKKGDRIAYPVHEGLDKTETVAFWKLVGTYLADGWTQTQKRNGNHGYNHKTIICCGLKNIQRLNDTLVKAGYKYTLSVEKTVCKAIICSAYLCDFLQQFGKYAHCKHLSPLCFELDNERKEALFEGWTADGYMSKDGSVRVTTVSQRLALEMAQIARDIYHTPVGVSKKTPSRARCMIEGRVVNERPQYHVEVTFCNRYGFYEDGYIWCNIKAIREEKEKNRVFNLSVKDEHSYNVHGIAVHNCQPFSLAGQRRGTEDLRFLWPEMLRAIKEIRPAYVLGENVPGILTDVQPGGESSMETEKTLFGENYYTAERGQFVVERICQDFEREGYTIIPLVIPACAVGAPHRRDRVWFIAKRITPDTKSNGGCGIAGGKNEPSTRQDGERDAKPLVNGEVSQGFTADPNGRGGISRGEGAEGYRQGADLISGEAGRGERHASIWNNGLSSLQRSSADSERSRGNKGSVNVQPELTDGERATGDGMQWASSDTEGGRSGRLRIESQEERARGGNELLGERGGLYDEGLPADFWRDFPTAQPVIRRTDDGLSEWMDSLSIPYQKWRAEAVKAYGNSMCEPLVKELLRAILLDIENDQRHGNTR